MATNSVGQSPHFHETKYDFWNKRMCLHIKAMDRKIWGVVEEDFVVLYMNNPTPREDEILIFSDQTLNMINEALDPKVLESIQDLEKVHEV